MSHPQKKSRKLGARLALLTALMMALALVYTQPRSASASIACEWMYKMYCYNNTVTILIKNCDGTYTQHGTPCLSNRGEYISGCTACP